MTTTYYTVWTPVKGIPKWITKDNVYEFTPHQEEAHKFTDGTQIDVALSYLNLFVDQVHIFKHTVTKEYLENPDLDKLD